MQDRPTIRELLEAVRGFLEDDVVPALDGRRRFHALVAANVLAIAGRELEGEEAALLAEWRGLAALPGGPRGEPPPRLDALRAAVRDATAALAERIRRGEADGDAVRAHVRATVVEKLRVANPRYLGSTVRLRPGDGLVVIDVQRDFLPGGSLAVPAGDEVVPVLNRYLATFVRAGLPIFATRDWHPPDHCSFRARGGPWPPHCVRESDGAAFAPTLELPPATVVVSKDTRRDESTYSAFAGGDVDDRLRAAGVRRLFAGGLATDYCVLHTVTDALERGYEVVLLADAIRAVDAAPGDGERAVAEMIRRGAVPLRYESVGG